ncbi:hypothetical protein ABVT39_018777 [Epinephelus coioides]
MAAVTQQATSRNGGSPRKHATQKGGEPVEREVQIARLQVRYRDAVTRLCYAETCSAQLVSGVKYRSSRSTDRSRVRGDTIAVRRGRITTYYKQTQTSRRITHSTNTGNIFTISVQPNSDAAVRINKPLQT